MKNITPTETIKVGISACVMGESVRFNGGHSQSRICRDQFSEYFSFIPFCPEVAAGFGIPRPTIRLIGDPDKPTLTYTKDETADLTEQLTQGFTHTLERCGELDGYILKKDSPSCGMERVKVYQSNGHPHEKRTSGLFAAALMKQYPNLPVEEDGRLCDPKLRENFVLRVFAHSFFRNEVLHKPSYHNLLKFHSSYKYLLMAHSPQAYKALGQQLAKGRNLQLETLIDDYFSQFMQAIKKPASRGAHCNVMQHIMGYLKKSLSADAKQDMLQVFEQYRTGNINLATPMTLLSHYIFQNGSDYIQMQRYLAPYPNNLGLRNQL